MHTAHGGVGEMKRNDHGWKLVSDSGCSLLVPDGPDGLAGIDIDIDHAEVPFVISVDNTDYIDEPGIDIEKMLEQIAGQAEELAALRRMRGLRRGGMRKML